MLYYSASRWRSVPTRTQQLVTRFKDAEVLFFEPSPSSLSRSRRKQDFKLEGRQVRPNVTVYTLPPTVHVRDNHPHWERHNQKKLARFLLKKLAAHRMRQPLIWACSPVYAHLPDLLPHHGLVYDCDQDWSSLPILWESELSYNADVIFAASQGLADHLAPCNANIVLLPNGVNYPMFSRTDDADLAFPGDLVPVRNPILGYSGTLWEDLDLEPVLHAARLRPDWSFLFVGRVRSNPLLSELKQLPNVHLLGHKPLVEVPEYVTRFDVCLSLLRRGQEDNDVLSARIFEYLSTGRPIVSMSTLSQPEEYPDVIYYAYGQADFASKCQKALEEPQGWHRERRRHYGAAAAWSGRAAEVLRILEMNGF